ncbi:hypothetical protein ST47_g8139 [Ascochyta rabiei]|uniref:Uncharacterized protein n=1 Tax=Didymella rabiei TaxID=5454 RepID=A0A162ZN71_DIDRA|nr:hypothetical protein ST47_g8139 [Ascochyta rabiei]
MAHLIFPIEGSIIKASSIRHKPTEIPRQLFYITRGATDAIEALELFLELLFEPSHQPQQDTHGSIGYLAFDAHVGDTACQLRACMLSDIMKHYRRPGSCVHVVAMRATISELKKLLENTTRLLTGLLDLDWNKIRSGGLEALGVPKSGMTLNELLFKLEWKIAEAKTLNYESSRGSSQESLGSMASSLSGADFNDALPSNRSEFSAMSPEEHWKPSDWRQVVQFLVYSYILSKYKQLIACNGVYRATLNPDRAFTMGQILLQREFGSQFVRPNKRAIEEEFLGLQRFVSGLSCAWLESRARTSWSIQPRFHSLLKSTIRTSAKGIHSVSSYVGFLMLRSLWAETSAPIIIMTTRFCPSGFHVNYFTATFHTIAPTNETESRHTVLPNISWELTRLNGREFSHLGQCLEPHFMISANSIDGNSSDYLARLPSAHRHSENNCDDNERHCSDMLESDQDRVVQAIFAEHRHYAFELSGEEGNLGEGQVVSHLMDAKVTGLSAAWEKSRKDSVALGTGSSLKLCMWQHVALESPARFLARVEGCDRPWVISDPIAKS